VGRNDAMRRSSQRRIDELVKWLEDLQQISRNGAVVLVEGKKDVEALYAMGFNGPVELCSQTFMQELCTDLSQRFPGSIIVVLTDWDRKGEYLAVKLERYLMGYGMSVNIELRRRLCAISGGDVKDVESIPTLYARLERFLSNRDYI